MLLAMYTKLCKYVLTNLLNTNWAWYESKLCKGVSAEVLSHLLHLFCSCWLLGIWLNWTVNVWSHFIVQILFCCTCIALHSSCLLPQSSKKNECRYGDCLNEVLLSHYYENSFHLVNRFCFCYVIGAKSRRDAASTARLKAWTYSNVWKTSIVYRNQFPIYVFENKQKKPKWSAEIVFQRRSRKKWNRNVKEGACARVLLWKEKVFGLFPFQAKK